MPIQATTQFLNNSLNDYFRAIIIGILIFLGLRIFKNIILGYLKKITSKIPGHYDDFIISLVEKISPMLFIVASVYFPLQQLEVNQSIMNVFGWIFSIVLTWEGVKLASLVVKFAADEYIERNNMEDSKADISIIQMGLLVANVAIWSLAILLLLSNQGFDVTALVASLGVGGIAVALAAQNILGDLFSSLTIFFDKPFQVGDFVVSGTDMGVVEKIGLKTTRIKTPK